jgi:hypothetical protein
MKRSRLVFGLVLGSLVLCLLLAALGGWLYVGQRRRAREERPLVLIHAPLNGDVVALGSGALVRASARAPEGVARLELWADGTRVAVQEGPEGAHPATLMLAAGWEPPTAGPHTLVVRAFSSGGVAGQSTRVVEAVELRPREAPSAGAHLVQDEGETWESVAAAHDVAVEDLEALNPARASGDPAPGDVLLYPDPADEAPAGEGVEEADPPPAEGPAPDVAPPAPADEPPGTLLDILELLGWEGLTVIEPAGAEEPLPLQVELLGLETTAPYDALHCYVALGDNDPRWYPDVDGDQSTDESFAPLGDGQWDVAASMAGDGAPLINWPADEPLPIDVTCVGLTGGGSDAVDLGRLLITARPQAWDGVTRRAVSDGFTLEYRIRSAEAPALGEPRFLDPDMTAPTNLRMGAWTLHWDYAPEPGEEPIDGFRVYLNNALQWVEPPEAQASSLPYEWLSPPCGETYRLYVTAFRYGSPDGPESFPSNTVTVVGDEPGSEDCQRALIVTFDTLVTRHLGGDGRREERTGSVGPAYGSFYVNDQQVTFDGRCLGPGLCGEFGLSHDTEYDVSAITSYFGDGPARFVVYVPPDEDLTLGFGIEDHDDRNADDEICAHWRNVAGDELNRVVESTVQDVEARCTVHFTIRPAFGSAVEGLEGGEPLPLLMVENLTVNEETGQLQIHVRNVGAGTWPAKDLEVAVTWPSGAGIGAYTWPELLLRPGERSILEHPDLVPGPHPPLGACVLLDPGNRVPEEDDQSPGWTRGRYCRPLPDLIVTDAAYDWADERLLVTVENVGEGSVERRDLGLQINLADGSYFAAPDEWWSDVSMAPHQTVRLVWENVGEAQRALMMGGYTVVIDPHNDLAEESGANNEYTVPPAARLRVRWVHIRAPYDVRNTVEYAFAAHAVSGDMSRAIETWRLGPDIDWGSCFEDEYCIRMMEGEEADTYWFDVAGDEDLELVLTVSHPGTLRGPVVRRGVFPAGEGWYAGGSGPSRGCREAEWDPEEQRTRTWTFGSSGGEEWLVAFNLCREEEP